MRRSLEIVDGRPPNFEDVLKVFPEAEKPGVIFAYGDKIYAPGSKGVLRVELYAHEIVHCDRQGLFPDRWWDLYMTDPKFRLEEEILAHRAEYRKYVERHANRLKRERALDMIAGKLASPLYGSLISLDQARKELVVR